MRAASASRTLVVTSALMLAVGVAACADDDASEPATLSGVEAVAPPEAAEGPAEPAKESPDGSGPPAAEPEEEEEAPETDRE